MKTFITSMLFSVLMFGVHASAVSQTLFALTNNNQLLTFNAATPGSVITVTLSGMQVGEKMTGIDVRPATGELYGLGLVDNGANRTGRIYRINPVTGAATQVGASPWSTALPDADFGGFNFNPRVDRIRVTFRSGQNFRVNPDTGALTATDTTLSQSGLNGVSYTNSDRSKSSTTLYGVNFDQDRLVTIGGLNGSPSPNGGLVTNVGATGIISTDAYAFEIVSNAGLQTAFGIANGRLYSVNLATGAFTLSGSIGAGDLSFLGLTGATTQSPMYALTNDNQLLTFSAAIPGAVIRQVAITGLQANETITGIDVRSETSELYGLGLVDDGATRTGRIYRINVVTGVATQVGSAPWSTGLPDTSFGGFDFNPVVDRIRVTFRSGENFRVNPVTGALVAMDTNLSVTGINGVSYTNNDLSLAGTTLYGLRFDTDSLVTIGGLNGSPSPNGGVVSAVGSTGIVANDSYALEILTTGGAQTAFATASGNLYSVNLATGAFTLRGAVGPGTLDFLALTGSTSGARLFRNGFE